MTVAGQVEKPLKGKWRCRRLAQSEKKEEMDSLMFGRIVTRGEHTRRSVYNIYFTVCARCVKGKSPSALVLIDYQNE